MSRGKKNLWRENQVIFPQQDLSLMTSPTFHLGFGGEIMQVFCS
jgi:hypothetical protein